MSENNRLFHWMGPKKVLWIHERDLKDLPDPTQVRPEPGASFYAQHHVWGTWSKGTYYQQVTPWNSTLMINWTQVIVIKEHHDES